MTTGLIDVHSHLLPGVDDGCKAVEESLACARILVDNGYTHSFCTPHIWPTFDNTIASIPPAVEKLQSALDDAKIPLKLTPGGEINLRPECASTPPDQVVTYAMHGKFALIDMWHDRIPEFVGPTIRRFQSLGLTVILAHPERMRAVQSDPAVVDFFTELGVLLQGNLQCFSDPPHADTRRVAERLLLDDRYFMLGSDLHSMEKVVSRMQGLKNARQLVGDAGIDRLMRANPSKLFEMT